MSARNFYIMQSAVAPMQSETPCYTPLTNHRTEVHTVPLVMAADYDALEAECERLRVKLMVIASAEPARHGIEWAKAIAAEGNGEPYAKWREAIDERDALAAELAAIKGQGPVAWLDPVRGLDWLVDRMTVAPGTKLYTLPAAPEGGEV